MQFSKYFFIFFRITDLKGGPTDPYKGRGRCFFSFELKQHEYEDKTTPGEGTRQLTFFVFFTVRTSFVHLWTGFVRPYRVNDDSERKMNFFEDFFGFVTITRGLGTPFI